MRSEATDLALRALGAEALLAALAHPARPGERVEELLLDLGVVHERAFAFELARRSGREFAGLRGFLPDERLFLYVPLAHALVERVCPLVLVGNSLKLASAYADPDLDRLGRAFPNLEVELLVAPRREILEALHSVTLGG
jgi:hypothetical protein